MEVIRIQGIVLFRTNLTQIKVFVVYIVAKKGDFHETRQPARNKIYWTLKMAPKQVLLNNELKVKLPKKS